MTRFTESTNGLKLSQPLKAQQFPLLDLGLPTATASHIYCFLTQNPQSEASDERFTRVTQITSRFSLKQADFFGYEQKVT
jgi:hypothetical protein